MCNYAYEFIAYCTSIIAKTLDGTIMHMRLFDFLAPEISRNMSYVGEFYKGGQYLYDAVLLGGSPLIPTAFKKSAFSVTLNQRNSATRSNLEFFTNMGMVSYGYK